MPPTSKVSLSVDTLLGASSVLVLPFGLETYSVVNELSSLDPA